MKASSFKLLDSSREVVTTKNGVLDPELVKPAVLGMRSSDIEADAAVENKVTTPKAVYDFVSGKAFLTEDQLATVGIYPSSATAASADLNTMRTQGTTLLQGNSVIQNGPLDAYPDGCLLRVYATTVSGSTRVVQYLTELGTCATYTRTGTGEIWSNWAGPVRAKTIIADPVTEMAVADETWGDCRYLDATFRKLSFRGRVRNLRRVSLEIVSTNSGVTGNIVLVPIVNGSVLSDTSFVVAVGAEPSVSEFVLEVASGTLALRRDTDDERDTLKDSGNTPVTAVVLSVILEVQYDA